MTDLKKQDQKYDLVFVGAGGFAREVYAWLPHSLSPNSFNIKGFLTNRPDDLNNFDIAEPVLGDVESYSIKENDRFVLAIGDVNLRKDMVYLLKKKGAQFITLIHKTAIVAKTAKIGEGVVVCPFVTISDSVVIADFVMMNFYSSCGHDVKVGKFSVFSPYATANGFSVIEDSVFLGSHSTVTAKIIVSERVKVNANTVVMRDAPPGTFVIGVPGKNTTIFF